MIRLEDFREVVPDKELDEIYSMASGLHGKNIVHVNATYQGGGVAEILHSLVQLMNDVGINAGWRILHGSQEFFEVTKSFHKSSRSSSLGKRLSLARRHRLLNALRATSSSSATSTARSWTTCPTTSESWSSAHRSIRPGSWWPSPGVSSASIWISTTRRTTCCPRSSPAKRS